MTKGQLQLSSFVVGGMLFSLVVVVFFVLVNQGSSSGAGFFTGYGYTPSLDTTKLDISTELSDTATTARCDIDPSDTSCPKPGLLNTISSGLDFTQSMLRGAFGAVKTIFSSMGVARTAAGTVMTALGVDPLVQAILVGILIFGVTIAAMYLIFNRGAV